MWLPLSHQFNHRDLACTEMRLIFSIPQLNCQELVIEVLGKLNVLFVVLGCGWIDIECVLDASIKDLL